MRLSLKKLKLSHFIYQELDEEEETVHQSKKLKTKQFLVRPPTPFPSFQSEDSLDTSNESNLEENYEISTINEDSGNSENESGDSPISEAAVEDDPPSDPISEDESDSGECSVKDTLRLKSAKNSVNPLEFQRKLSLN